jgi:hypothetical protein
MVYILSGSSVYFLVGSILLPTGIISIYLKPPYLKSRKIICRLNLLQGNSEIKDMGFAKMTYGGEEGTRTPTPFGT